MRDSTGDLHSRSSLHDDLKRLGYLESRIDRVLGVGEARRPVFGAARLALIGGPLLALWFGALHFAAGSMAGLMLREGLLAMAALFAVDTSFVFALVWIGLALLRRRVATIAIALGATSPLIGYGLAAWWHLRGAWSTPSTVNLSDVSLVVSLFGIALLIAHALIAGRAAGRLARSLTFRASLGCVVIGGIAAWVTLLWPTPSAPSAPDFEPALTGQRLVWIQLDGCTPERLDRARRAGWVPTLDRELSTGSVASIRIDESWLPPQVWTTAATGVLPPRHGIEQFASVRLRFGHRALLADLAAWFAPFLVPLDAMPLSSDERRVPTLGEIVARLGFRVVAINNWCSGPTTATQEAIISDRAIRSLVTVRDAELDESEARPALVIDATRDLWDRFRQSDISARAETVDAFCLQCVERLRAARDPQLTIVTLSGIDWLALGRDEVALERGLRSLDVALASFLATLDARESVIISGAAGYAEAADTAFAVFDGPAFTRATAVDIRLEDIAPTALRVLGFPTADDFDGRVVERVLDLDLRSGSATSPARSIVTYGERSARSRHRDLAAERRHLEALETLGYLGGRR